MKELCIVPCGKRKIWDHTPDAGPTRARNAYIGPFVRKCIAYAEIFYPGTWCILSAKHGFLWPDDLVPGPYDVTFLNKRSNPVGVEELIAQVISRGLSVYDRIVVLGGRDYADIVTQSFSGKEVIRPLAGRGGIRQMMHILEMAISSHRRL